MDLSFTNFGTLKFTNVKHQKIVLEGMTYKNITCGENWENLLQFLGKSPYHAQPYNQLVTFFQQSGYPDRADEVFIAGKGRELGQKRWWVRLLTFIFWDLLTGYGRKPYRAFVAGLGITVIGAVV